MIGCREDQADARREDVEEPLGGAAVHALADMEQAEEPDRRHVRDRHAAEHVLIEARQRRDPEAVIGHVEEPVHGFRGRLGVREHDVVGLLGLHHGREVAQDAGAGARDRALRGRRERAEDLERHPVTAARGAR